MTAWPAAWRLPWGPSLGGRWIAASLLQTHGRGSVRCLHFSTRLFTPLAKLTEEGALGLLGVAVGLCATLTNKGLGAGLCAGAFLPQNLTNAILLPSRTLVPSLLFET